MTATHPSAMQALNLAPCLSGDPTIGTFGQVAFVGDGTTSIVAWGAQLETGPVATSPIITAGSAVTRAADAWTWTGTQFSDWYNQAGGVWVVETILPQVPASNPAGRVSFAVHDGTSNNRYIHRAQVIASVNTQVLVRASSATVATLQRDGIVNTGLARLATRLATNNFAASFNGLAPATATSGNVPSSVNTLTLGALESAAENLNGQIRQLLYFPPGPAADRIQALSVI